MKCLYNLKNARYSADQIEQVTFPSSGLKFSHTAGPTLCQQVLHVEAPLIFFKTCKKSI